MPQTPFAQSRQATILALLDAAGSITVAQAASATGVSQVTARADLDALAQAGKLRRTHGGAVPLVKTLTVSVQDMRVNVNPEKKASVARAARELVRDGDSILVDSGTTALAFVATLGNLSGVTVVTGDFSVADYIDRALPSVDVVMLGGMLHKAHRYTTGTLTLQALSSLRPDKAFVCPGAYAPGVGFMTNNDAMAELKRAFMRCADFAAILMDSTKVGASGLIRFATLDEADVIVTDAGDVAALERDLEDAHQTSKLIFAG